jgi:hypothetical protein
VSPIVELASQCEHRLHGFLLGFQLRPTLFDEFENTLPLAKPTVTRGFAVTFEVELAQNARRADVTVDCGRAELSFRTLHEKAEVAALLLEDRVSAFCTTNATNGTLSPVRNDFDLVSFSRQFGSGGHGYVYITENVFDMFTRLQHGRLLFEVCPWFPRAIGCFRGVRPCFG